MTARASRWAASRPSACWKCRASAFAQAYSKAHPCPARIVQAPPGIPVGTFVARGEVALGFQQLSELMHLDGIIVVGTLPDAVAITTIFSAATCTVSKQQEDLAKLFAFMAASGSASVKQKHGMQSA